jgi:GT2 family glycosyltransferase
VKLAIVIIHYNTSADLDRCLESLTAYPPACDHAIVVVDNASQDTGLAAVQERFPSVHWLLNSENVGYARGANLGMATEAAEYYLLLNPDIAAQPGAIDALLAFADSQPKAGIVGPQLLNEDGSIQDSCRRFYTFRTLLMRRTFLGKLFPRSQIVDDHLMRDFDHRSARPVDWVLGGCLLARRAAVERVGTMDERFFLYFEDVDWCYRMWQAGHEVLYTPDARFMHRHRRESAKGALQRSFWHHLGSLISFYEKWGLLVYLVKKWRRPLSILLLWLVDMLALIAAFLGAYGLRAWATPLFDEALFPLSEYRPLLIFSCLLVSATFLLSGRYRDSRHRRPRGFLTHIRRVGIVSLLLLASTYLSHQQVYSRAVLLIFVPLFALTTALGEDWFRAVRRRMERGYISLERTLLVGDPNRLAAWLERVRDARGLGIDLVGYLAEPAVGGAQALPPLNRGEVPWLGPWSDVLAVVERYRVSQVVFWEQPRREDEDLLLLTRLRMQRMRLRWRVPEAWLLMAGARSEQFGGQVSGVLEPATGSLIGSLLVRSLDLVLALALSVISVLPFLWLRLVRGGTKRGLLRDVTCVDLGDHPVPLRLACSVEGRVRPLWWQWSLAWSVLRGRLSIYGSRLRLEGRESGFTAPGRLAAFWRLGPRKAGLTGRWALPAWGPGGEAAVQSAPLEGESRRPFSFGVFCAMIISVMRQLLLDPGGLDRLPASGNDQPPEQTESPSQSEVP